MSSALTHQLAVVKRYAFDATYHSANSGDRANDTCIQPLAPSYCLLRSSLVHFKTS